MNGETDYGATPEARQTAPDSVASTADSFDVVVLRRSTGLTQWKTPGVIDGSDAERADFVRVDQVVADLERIGRLTGFYGDEMRKQVGRLAARLEDRRSDSEGVPPDHKSGDA